MITERTLRQWRREALNHHNKNRMIDSIAKKEPAAIDVAVLLFDELNSRILRLTQELMDISLVRKG